jgi:hypothetical protein
MSRVKSAGTDKGVWKVSGLGYLCCGQRVIAKTHAVPEHVAQSATLEMDDAEYIAKACNAYPKLVEALRKVGALNAHGGAGPHCTCSQGGRESIVATVLREIGET